MCRDFLPVIYYNHQSSARGVSPWNYLNILGLVLPGLLHIPQRDFLTFRNDHF